MHTPYWYYIGHRCGVSDINGGLKEVGALSELT